MEMTLCHRVAYVLRRWEKKALSEILIGIAGLNYEVPVVMKASDVVSFLDWEMALVPTLVPNVSPTRKLPLRLERQRQRGFASQCAPVHVWKAFTFQKVSSATDWIDPTCS
jgi:hypothetical protein